MSKIKESFKTNNGLRRFVKKLKIFKEYYHDACDYSKYYLESAESKGKPKYRIMLLIHSLEKGMCMPNPRPYGQQKALQLTKILKEYGRRSDMEFEYDLGVSALSAWVSFFDQSGWKRDDSVGEVEQFVNEKPVMYQAGRKEHLHPRTTLENANFTEVMLSRHSVRDFDDRELMDGDIQYALNMFIEAPTACNRQMCKVFLVKNPEVVELLNKTVLGVGGFNKKTMHYFIITYDIAAFDFFGERNQGYLNAGLVAMNFANGLHARGIGSCFMQWANKRSEDANVRKALRLKNSERIAIVLGAGYYKEKSLIPCSDRRNINDIFSIVE